MREYKCLSKQTYSINEYQIVPIRDEDKYDIMQWRNEQIYHLRQSNPLDYKTQNIYFKTVIKKLFLKTNPTQILFSFLKNRNCIGYGGLVHINWIDKNAEISFVLSTELESLYFNKLWRIYLKLIEEVAFNDLKFHKIYTYAFDLRPKLFEVLELEGYSKEAILKNHVIHQNNYIDVIIHSKFNKLH
jgi:RimJ/RimL family protein N-acetyltransferase